MTSKSDRRPRPLSVAKAPAGSVSLSSIQGPTLALQPVGTSAVLGVPRLDAARVRRLAELGLRPGEEVLVLHRTAGQGRVLAVGETRLALDRATLEALPVRVGAADSQRATPSDAPRDLP